MAASLAAQTPQLTRERLFAAFDGRIGYSIRLHAGTCTISYGKTGKAQPTVRTEEWRTNGALRTWKRDAERFELPVKHGLYDYGTVTRDNVHLFHLAADCAVQREADAYWNAKRAE